MQVRGRGRRKASFEPATLDNEHVELLEMALQWNLGMLHNMAGHALLVATLQTYATHMMGMCQTFVRLDYARAIPNICVPGIS